MDDVFLLDRQRQTGGDTNLLANDIDAGDFFGDGVLDLHPGVHFHEVHLALGEQKLHGAGVLVTDCLGCTYRQIADVGALFGRQLRAGSNFDELLIAPLNRTVALEQVHHVAEAVAQNLRFNVLGIDDALLEKDFCRAEGLGRFGNHPREGLLEFFAAVAAADTTSTAPGGGLEHHRVTDTLAFNQRLVDICHVAFSTGRDRHTGLNHAAPGLGLVSHAANHFCGGTDEFDPSLDTDIGQLGILGKKAITGMQRIAAGFHCQIHQFTRVQVTRQRFGTNAIGFVGTFDMQGMPVRFGKDRYRANAHLGACTHDANGNLPAVGDQNFCYHWRFPRPTLVTVYVTECRSATLCRIKD